MMAHPGNTAIRLKAKKICPLIPAWPLFPIYLQPDLRQTTQKIGNMSNAIGKKPPTFALTQTVICIYSVGSNAKHVWYP